MLDKTKTQNQPKPKPTSPNQLFRMYVPNQQGCQSTGQCCRITAVYLCAIGRLNMTLIQDSLDVRQTQNTKPAKTKTDEPKAVVPRVCAEPAGVPVNWTNVVVSLRCIGVQ